MADTIKIGNLDISSFKVGSDDCKVYLGDVKLYPTEEPTPSLKFTASYSDGQTYSAECDSSTELTSGETRPNGYEASGMTSAVIGNCVTSLGNRGFYGCTSLTSIEIPNSVTTIGNQAFYYCSGLTSIDIPDSVTSIGNQAFYYCKSLSSVTIGDGVTTIGTRAFYNCIGLTSITVNATTPPTLDSSTVFGGTNNAPIYVPSESVASYKSDSRWSTYADRIQAIPNS